MSHDNLTIVMTFVLFDTFYFFFKRLFYLSLRYSLNTSKLLLILNSEKTKIRKETFSNK